VKWRIVLVAIAACVLAACSSSSSHSSAPTVPASTTTTPPTTVAAAACNRPHPAGQSSQSFAFDGQQRTYQLYVPKGYDGTKNVPVVFDFHGFGSNAVQQMVYGNFKPEAEKSTFLIVAPDGQGADRHFNLTSEPGLQNDLQMVPKLLDHIEATLCVDPSRVYSTGMSDGGAMTSVLACTQNKRFAAFAPVAVVLNLPCGSTPVAFMGFSGSADPVVPYNGGKVNCCGGTTLGAAPKAAAGWAAHDKCNATPEDTKVSSEVMKRTWSGCEPNGQVIFYTIVGGGHTWPGSPIKIASLGKTTDQIDASATISKFFQQHTLSQ
jgi:polyhydroxybutyrate depolymerase